MPDLSRPEAFRWFYYRAKRYLQAGYEAIHLGQSHLVAGADPTYRQLQRLCNLIRKAAAEHARRGWVILDAHSHGVAIDGELLFDFTSRPLSVRGLTEHVGQIALIKRGESIGGRHPGGWDCQHGPTVIEVDNWGGYSLPPGEPDWDNPDRLARHGCWGYDQVCWYARLPREARADFLRYAQRWTCLQGDEWFFQMPLTRSMGKADLDRGGGKTQHYYRGNRYSDACVNGLDDEDAVVAAWADGDAYPYIDPEPVDPQPTPAGLTVPEPVTVMGPLQPLLGGVPGDASCPWSRLHHVGAGRFSRTFALPFAGQFGFTITADGSQDDPTNQGGVAGGKPWQLDIPRAGTLVKITFDYEARTVQATDAETGQSLLVE